MDRRALSGLAAASLSSLLGGSAVVVTRLAVAGTDALTVAALRYALGAACLGALVALRPAAAAPRWTGRDWRAALLLGLLFCGLFPWLFTAALARTTAARGALALSCLPLLTLALGALARAEPIGRAKLAGVLLALGGVTLALAGAPAGGLPDGHWQGDLLMVACALCGALYNVLAGPWLRRLAPLRVTAVGMAAGAAALLALRGATQGLAPPPLDATGWLAIAWLGVIGCGLVFLLWSIGLERTTPTRVAVTVALNPVSAMLLGPLLLGEQPSLGLAAGVAAVLAGIALTAHEPRRA